MTSALLLTAALVFGHMNPDTDSVMGAIAAADLYKQRGMEVTAVAQGRPTPETAFVLEKFKLPEPKVVESVAGKQVVLVDFSDTAQAPKDIKQAQVVGIIDHHKLGDITTDKPLEAWIQPVGSTATVLHGMYSFYGKKIPPQIAGGMLCAILSDTVIFKSATTTDADKKAAADLAKIAGVKDMKGLGMELFRIKSNVDKVAGKELLFRDYKDFTMNGKKVGVGQLEVVDLAALEPRKAELQKALADAKKDGRHSVFLMLTDIMKEGTLMLVASEDPAIMQKAFGLKDQKDGVWMSGVMSRKKQIVPNLEKAFK